MEIYLVAGCGKEWHKQQNTHEHKRVFVRAAILKPFLSSAATHTTEKCLKFIWSLQRHINILDTVFFCKHTHSRSPNSFFWYSIYFVLRRFRRKKKYIPSRSKRNSVMYFWMAKKAWKHITTSHNCNIKQPYIWNSYLHELFFFVSVHVSVGFFANFFFCWMLKNFRLFLML